MTSEFRQTTRALLMTVEAHTSYPVHVIPEPKLQTAASMSIARGDKAMHVIRYKPVVGEEPDYLICTQCGFILRKFSVPTEQRVDFSSSRQGQYTTMALLRDGVAKKFKLDATQLSGLRDQILDGLLIHLLSIPVGLRVSSWLETDHPELNDLQRSSVLRDLRQNRETMDPRIKQTFPPKIFNATQAISAAYAMHWAGKLGEPQLAAPWLSDFRQEGLALLAILNEVSSDAASDQDLVDRWAEKLKLKGWYSWVPYQAPR